MICKDQKTMIILILLLLLFCNIILSEQNTDDLEKTTVKFTATVALKIFDVLAIDDDDKPVTNLTKNDFELYIDGKRIPIDTFDIKDFRTSFPILTTSETSEENIEKTNNNYEYDDYYNDRLIILVFNDLHFFKGSRQSLANGVLDFIDENISSNDYISIYYMQGSAIVLLLPFTNNKNMIKRSIIDNIIQNKSHLPFVVPDSFSKNELWYAGNLESFKTPIEDLKRQYKHVNIMTSFHTFIRLLSLYKGRKELFVFSDASPYKYYQSSQDYWNYIKLINDAKKNNIIINTFDLSKAGNDFNMGGRSGKNYSERITVHIASGIEKFNEYLIGLAGDTNGLFFRHCNRRGEVGKGMKIIYERSSYVYYIGSYLKDLPFKIKYDVEIKCKSKHVKLIYANSFRLIPEYKKMDRVDRWIQMLEALYGSSSYSKISFISHVMQFPYDSDRTLVLTIIKSNSIPIDTSALDVAIRYFNPESGDDSQQFQSWNINKNGLKDKNLWLFIGSLVQDGEYNYRYLIRNTDTGDLGNSKGHIMIGLKDRLFSSIVIFQDNNENQVLTNLLSRDIYKIQEKENREPSFLFDIKLIPFIYGEKILFPTIDFPLDREKPAFLMFMYNFNLMKKNNLELSYRLSDLNDNELDLKSFQLIQEDEFSGGWCRATFSLSLKEIPLEMKYLRLVVYSKDRLGKEIEKQSSQILVK